MSLPSMIASIARTDLSTMLVSNARRLFYAAGRHWAFFPDGDPYGATGVLVFSSSVDGVTWDAPTTVRALNTSCEFAVYWDGTYVHYAANGVTINAGYAVYRRGTPNSNGTVSWSAAEQQVPGIGASSFGDGVIGVSVDSGGYVWVGYSDHQGASTYPYVTKSGNNDGTWGATPAGFPYKLSTDTGNFWSVVPVALTSLKMAALYQNGAGVKLKIQTWTGAAWNAEKSVASNSSGYYQYSAVADGDDVEVVYLKATTFDFRSVTYTYTTNSFGSETVVQVVVTGITPVLCRNSTTDDLYVFWANNPASGHVYYKMRVGSTWDTDATDWFTDNDSLQPLSVSCFYNSYSNRLGFSYSVHGSTPYNLKYNYLSIEWDCFFSTFDVDGVDYHTEILRAETWRAANSVGIWAAGMRNIGGQYNALFDVQDSMILGILGNQIMAGQVDGGPAVSLRNQDLESVWEPYLALRGNDRAQDLMFHNDFEKEYPNPNQILHEVLDDVFNTELVGLTNITYVPPVGNTPVIGSIEFKRGASFLGVIQEMHKRAGYVFHVDDDYILQSGVPGFNPTGVTITCIAEDALNNVVDAVDLDERDGDKHYNHIELIGKNPMFDSYTEYNAADWTNVNATLTDEIGTTIAGDYSIKAVVTDPNVYSYAGIDFWNGGAGKFNYSGTTGPVINFTKGTVGCWVFWHGGIYSQPWRRFDFALYDNLGNFTTYRGESTKAYPDEWTWVEATLGEKPSVLGGNDQWVGAATDFNWKEIRKIYVGPAMLLDDPINDTHPDYYIIDGLSLPIPARGIAENTIAQATYRKRPYVDSWAHIRDQNTLQAAADQLLVECQSTQLKKIKAKIPGDYRVRYTGTGITVNIPSMGVSNAAYYLTSIHHVAEPWADTSEGFGHRWTMEIEAMPVSGVAHDMARLRAGSLVSITVKLQFGGVGAGAR